MKVELFEIVEAFESFTNLRKSNELPFKLAWEISDLLEPLEKHYKRFQDEKNKLIKEFGEPDKDKPDMYIIKPEKARLFSEKMQEIGKTPIELKNIVKIEKNKLFVDDIKINGGVNLQALKIFIKE
jgi:hypothetical protein